MARTTERSVVRAGRGKRPRARLWAAGLLLAVAAALAVFAIQARQDSDGAPVTNDPGVAHVHGLGINPANGDVYAATHLGVFRITKGGKATRIADRYQDTMGFTVVGPDHFLASGHPDLREDLPPLLGLLESTDAGRTWEEKSLLGEADFHALRYMHGTIYGYDSTGSGFMVSRDGRRWDTRSKTTLRDFAVSPKDPEVVLATTPNGLERSEDGGRTWKDAQSPPQPVLIAWEGADALWLVDFAGGVHVSADGGATWDQRGNVSPRPEAFLATGDRLYAAVEDGIYASRDGARTWKPLFREEGAH